MEENKNNDYQEDVLAPQAPLDYSEESAPEVDHNHQETHVEHKDKQDVPRGTSEGETDKDEYGNPKPKPRMYTEEEHKELVNKAVRERLERFERNQGKREEAPAQQEQKQTHFHEKDLEAELEHFVEQTFNKMGQRQYEQQRQMQQERENNQFREKFQSGMNRFDDFEKVVGSQPISDYMAESLKGVDDPSAFIYAASKNHSDELSRISRLPSPYQQIIEMGKLEERMKRSQSGTRAPKPATRLSDDSTVDVKARKDDSLDALLAQNDAQRVSKMRKR